ncbi:hypothetical protein JBO44_14225 [Enterobacter asburiae]|uniref:hypothetical protein n=1 Tax=Enterobacter asburiae TaxID=61645 RepID=UPI00192CCC2E|nr:hypothetical protein [Enterobacter asburiae]MBL5942670.1 hypothetical protein [Enterobacter asburiae]MBL5945014.1 hypothetical protein [Enterobacter asburiae]MBL5951307.1 hypothetical protein [Enterobacter asburiae]MBL5953135.1 hypothetical protein [Enterobacter asburiae]
MNQKGVEKMNEHHKKQIEVIREIEAQGFTTQEAAALLLAGELSRLNDSMDYLKRATGNIDDTLSRM